MDFNVKKLVGDAGAFISRAVQVRDMVEIKSTSLGVVTAAP